MGTRADGIVTEATDLQFQFLQNGLNLKQIIKETQKRFKNNFNSKLFLEQLVYFEDIQDFSIEFIEFKHTSKEIQKIFIDLVKKIVNQNTLTI